MWHVLHLSLNVEIFQPGSRLSLHQLELVNNVHMFCVLYYHYCRLGPKASFGKETGTGSSFSETLSKAKNVTLAYILTEITSFLYAF